MTQILWKPQAKQALFQTRTEYEALYGGAAGGGKSDAILTEALRQVDKSNYRALILRKTVPQLRELIDRSNALYPLAFEKAVYKSLQHSWVFESGAKITFGSMHHTQDRFQYQGSRFDFIAFDELTHFTFEEYSYMFSRNRPGAPGMRVYIRASANPGGVGHSWVKARFIDPAPPLTPIKSQVVVQTPNGEKQTLCRERIFVPSTVFDNAQLMNNDPNYVAALAMLPEAEKKALLYGDWNSFKGQVFSEFRNEKSNYISRRYTHVIEPFDIPRHWQIYRGFDFGYTKPYAVSWFAVDTDGCIFNIKEIYGSTGIANEGIKETPTQIAQRIREAENTDRQLKGREIIGIADPSIYDKSRGESVAQIMERRPNHVFFIPGDNTRLAGKMQIHQRLSFDDNGNAKLYFFSNCTQAIRTLPALVYSQIRTEDVDTDCEDHLYDVLRYVLMDRPICIEQGGTKAKVDLNNPLI